MSNMDGEKAQHLADHASRRGWDYLRLDMSGHGRSEGRFEHGTMGQWRQDTLLALDQVARKPVILVGSSIGGWLALLAALDRPSQVAGLLLIAPAPDMTRRVAWNLPAEAHAALQKHGVWLRPSLYGAPIPVTRRMLDDGEFHCLLDAPIELSCPIRILHGQQDADVPWQGSLTLAGQLQSPDVQVTLLKHGNHRLSRPDELSLMTRTLDSLRKTVVESS